MTIVIFYSVIPICELYYVCMSKYYYGLEL